MRWMRYSFMQRRRDAGVGEEAGGWRPRKRRSTAGCASCRGPGPAARRDGGGSAAGAGRGDARLGTARVGEEARGLGDAGIGEERAALEQAASAMQRSARSGRPRSGRPRRCRGRRGVGGLGAGGLGGAEVGEEQAASERAASEQAAPAVQRSVRSRRPWSGRPRQCRGRRGAGGADDDALGGGVVSGLLESRHGAVDEDDGIVARAAEAGVDAAGDGAASSATSSTSWPWLRAELAIWTSIARGWVRSRRRSWGRRGATASAAQGSARRRAASGSWGRRGATASAAQGSARRRQWAKVLDRSAPRLAGIHDVFHVSALRRYIFDPSHVIDFTPLEIGEDLNYEERQLRILARETKELRNRVIPYVKVQWSNHEEREATWEPETVMRESYSYLFDALS
uniref:Chromo domain-containing protein n=1 Tax=Ananas comosus var. bracteatus TaxID=296719 RepID=A0A6V7QHR6_ANACO|nr:unnamed protein product [Ananas comosus var. bracteatus]